MPLPRRQTSDTGRPAPILSRAYAKRSAPRDRTGGLPARNEMALGHLHVVSHLARPFRGRGLDDDDLHQEGFLGLWRATLDFDPERGASFATYASIWIRAALGAAVADAARPVRLPQRQHLLARRAPGATAALRARLGRDPTHAEAADALGVTPEHLACVLDAGRPTLPLDRSSGAADDPVQQIADPASDPADVAARRDLEARVRDLVRGLRPADRLAVELRYGLADGRPRTLHEIAEAMRVSESRVRQLERRAIEDLAGAARLTLAA